MVFETVGCVVIARACRSRVEDRPRVQPGSACLRAHYIVLYALKKRSVKAKKRRGGRM